MQAQPNQNILIATFYRFFPFADYRQWQVPLHRQMEQSGVRGIILLAEEGINATVAGPEAGISQLLDTLKADERMQELFIKTSRSDAIPFEKAKVRLKREIITLNLPANTGEKTARHVSPEEWNRLLDDPDVLVLDTRNDYETHLGTFERATIWPIKDFQELPERITAEIPPKQKVAMFCTGGVRCEKLSSWMMDQGYDEIYQLDGGIVHYLNEMPAEASKWQGECYVFDDRVAVGPACTPSATASQCPRCGHALTPQDREHPAWLPAIQCGFCVQ